MLPSTGMQMSYLRIQKNWTQPSLRMLLPLTEHEIYISRHHHIHTMQFTPWKQLRTTVPLVFASCPPHEKRQVMSDEIECGSDPPIISICASLPLFIYCSRAVIAVSNFAMPARINAIKKNWHHLKTMEPHESGFSLNVHGTSMVWFHANIMHAGNQQQKEWLKGTYHKRHYWLWNTVYDANTGEIG